MQKGHNFESNPLIHNFVKRVNTLAKYDYNENSRINIYAVTFYNEQNINIKKILLTIQSLQKKQ